MPQARRASGSIFIVATANGHQADLLFAQLDLEFIARLEVERGGVGLTHQQVAVELHLGGIAELAATFAFAAAVTQADALGFQQSFIEGGEVQELTTVFLTAYIAAATNLGLTWKRRPAL